MATAVNDKISYIKQSNKNINLFLRGATNRSIIERDILLQYSIVSFFQELSFFITENKPK